MKFSLFSVIFLTTLCAYSHAEECSQEVATNALPESQKDEIASETPRPTPPPRVYPAGMNLEGARGYIGTASQADRNYSSDIGGSGGIEF